MAIPGTEFRRCGAGGEVDAHIAVVGIRAHGIDIGHALVGDALAALDDRPFLEAGRKAFDGDAVGAIIGLPIDVDSNVLVVAAAIPPAGAGLESFRGEGSFGGVGVLDVARKGHRQDDGA